MDPYLRSGSTLRFRPTSEQSSYVSIAYYLVCIGTNHLITLVHPCAGPHSSRRNMKPNTELSSDTQRTNSSFSISGYGSAHNPKSVKSRGRPSSCDTVPLQRLPPKFCTIFGRIKPPILSPLFQPRFQLNFSGLSPLAGFVKCRDWRSSWGSHFHSDLNSPDEMPHNLKRSEIQPGSECSGS